MSIYVSAKKHNSDYLILSAMQGPTCYKKLTGKGFQSGVWRGVVPSSGAGCPALLCAGSGCVRKGLCIYSEDGYLKPCGVMHGWAVQAGCVKGFLAAVGEMTSKVRVWQ